MKEIDMKENGMKDGNAAEMELRFARPEIVESLDHDIEQGRVLELIERLDDLRRELLGRIDDGGLFDRDVEEYHEYFSELTTVRMLMEFLEGLNSYGPESQLTEARRLLEEKFGKEAGGWLR